MNSRLSLSVNSGSLVKSVVKCSYSFLLETLTSTLVLPGMTRTLEVTLSMLQRLLNSGTRHRVAVDKSFCVTTTRYSVRPPL